MDTAADATVSPPLHEAAQRGHADIVEVLIHAGSNILLPGIFRFFKPLLLALFTFLAGLTVSLPAVGASHLGTPPEAANTSIWNPEALEKWSHLKEEVLTQYHRLEQFILDEDASPWKRKVVQ